MRGMLLAIALLAGFTAGAAGQDPIRVPAVPVAPVIDGRLDDTAWAGAAVLDDWVQTQPGDNVTPHGTTTLMLVHDDDALYVGIRARDPRGVRYAIHPRDQVLEQGQDWVGLLLDTFDHRRQAFGFALNPIGIQGDGIMLEGGDVVEWDAIFQSDGRIHDDGLGFDLELRIPFRSLRFQAAPVQRWGILLSRMYGRTGAEDAPWPLDRDRGCGLCQMRPMELAGVRPGRNLELNPSLVGSGEASSPGAGAPLGGYGGALEPSLNVKYGLGGNLTLDGTLNPDFSQIESDAGQLEVNNRFALFFPEKRPFFLEGADIFRTAITPPGESPFSMTPVNLIHSRTILAPDWGLKLSGKSGPVGVGAIVARDGAARSFEEAELGHSDVLIARSTMDVLNDGHVGGVLTARRHGGVEDLVGGMDTRLRFSNLSLRGLFATSRYGSAALDGATTRAGSALHAQAGWQSRHWTAGAAVIGVSPGFAAPLGFVPRTDMVTGTGSIAYIWQGSGLVHRIQPQLRYERVHDQADGGRLLRPGALADELWEPSIGVTFARSINVGAGYHRAFTHFDDRTFDAMDRWGFFFSSQTLDWLHLSANGIWGEDVIFADQAEDERAHPGWIRNLALTASLRPVPALRTDLSVQSSRVWRRDADAPRASLYADAMIPRLRVAYQATRRLGLRGVAEWRDTEIFHAAGTMADRDERLQFEFLASYVIDAGSAIHIGWTELQRADLTPGLEPARRGGVAKATYVWRL